MRRSTLAPIFPYEMEPGEAIDFVQRMTFPFDAADPLPSDVKAAVAAVASDPKLVQAERYAARDFWMSRAEALRHDSSTRLR